MSHRDLCNFHTQKKALVGENRMQGIKLSAFLMIHKADSLGLNFTTYDTDKKTTMDMACLSFLQRKVRMHLFTKTYLLLSLFKHTYSVNPKGKPV